MRTLSFIFKLAPLISALVSLCCSQDPARHPHLHLHLHPHLHKASVGTGLEQTLELRYALRIQNPGSGYTAQGVAALSGDALGIGESVTLDTWQSLIKNLLLGKGDQATNQTQSVPPVISLRNNNHPIPSISINEKINSKQVNVGKSRAEYTDLQIGETVAQEVGLELLKHLQKSPPKVNTATGPVALQYPDLQIGESVAQQVGRELLRHLKLTTPKPKPTIPDTTKKTTQMGFWERLELLMKKVYNKPTTEATPSTTMAKTLSTEATSITTRKTSPVTSSSTSQFITQTPTPNSRKLTKSTEGTTLTSLHKACCTKTSLGTKTQKESTISTQKTSETTKKQTTVSTTTKVTTEMPKKTTGIPPTTITALDKTKSVAQSLEKLKEISTIPTTKTVATQTTERGSVTPKMTTLQKTPTLLSITVPPQTSLPLSTEIKEQTKYSTVVNKQKTTSTVASSTTTGTTIIIPTVHLTKVPNITIQTRRSTTALNPTFTTVSEATKLFGTTGIKITLKKSPGSSTSTLLQESSTKYATTPMHASPRCKGIHCKKTKSATPLRTSVTTKGTTVPVTTSKFPSSVTNLPTNKNTDKISTSGSVLTTKSQFASKVTSVRSTTGTLQSQTMGSTTKAASSTTFSTSKPLYSTAATSLACNPLKRPCKGKVQNKSSTMATYNNLTSARILAVTTAIPLMLGKTTSIPTTVQTKKNK